MIIKKILYLIFLLSPYIFFGQSFKTLDVKFLRIIIKGTKEETTQGNIYYQAPEKIFMEVTLPIKQYIVIEKNTMLIYYPDNHSGLKFKSKNPIFLPFFQTFIGMLKDDFGLTKLNFKLVRKEQKEDVVISYWKPPSNDKNNLKYIVIGVENSKLIFTEAQSSDGKIIAKTTYHKHIQYGSSFFPLEIISTKYEKESIVNEKIVYTEPHFDSLLPENKINFKIPPDTKIEEIRW